MVELSDRHWWGRKRDDRKSEALVLEAIRERGAAAVAGLRGPARAGEMWNWKPAKRALEHLFAAGEVVVAGRDGFQRLYDLPERVIPRSTLDAPDAVRGRVPARVRAARGAGPRGADRGRHRRALPPPRRRGRHAPDRRRPRRPKGRVRRVAVDDGGPPVVVPAEAEIDGSVPRAGVLLSPFDNLLWDRAFVERVFGFRHLIEVYKREHERVYGYYVLAVPVRRPPRRPRRSQGRPQRRASCG